MGFIFGEGTPWTYDEVQRKRKVAEAMAGQIGSPRNVGEGLSAIGKALAVRGIEKRADRRMGELQGEADKAWEGVFGALTGGRTGGGRTYSAPVPPVSSESIEGQSVADDTMRALGREPIGMPAEVRAGVFAGESGGDYDALYGYQNREGGRYAGVKPTEMTVGEVMAFQDPGGDYGQWVKGQVGRVATPVGAYQVVGTTLQDAVRAGVVSPDEKFTPEVQDRVGDWIYKTQGTGAWEGYRGAGGGGRTSPQGQNSLQAIAAAMSNPIIRNDPGKMAILQAMMGQALTPPKNPWDVRSVGDELVRVNSATGQVEPLYVGQDSPLVSNTINSGIDTSELDKTLDKREGDLWGTYLEAGNNSAAMQSDMEALMQLAQIAPQGPLVGRLAEAFPGFSSAGAAFNSIVKRLAPTMRATGSGSTSDIEYQGMLDSLPKLVNRPEANVVIAQMMSNKARINMERAEVIRAYRNKEIGVQEARSRISQIDQQSIMTPEMAALLRQAEPQATEGDGFRDVGDGVSIRRKD